MRINIDDTTLDDDASHFLYDGEPFTGELVETDPAGSVIALTPVVDGRRHGLEQAWYRDGTLRSETTVVGGVAMGTSKEWHPNGRLAEERDFDDRGDLVAVRRWSEDGSPVALDRSRRDLAR